MDEPFGDSSVIPTMLVSKLARKHVTMTLSGDGGDELFLGYGSYTWAERMSNPFIQAARKPIHAILSRSGKNRLERAAHHFNYTDYESIRTHILSQEQCYYTQKEISRLLVNPTEKPSVTGKIPPLARKLRPSEEQALFDLGNYLKDDLLAKVDRSTMQFSLETRVPLLDYRIVEFALNLHPSLKIKDGQSKYLLRQVLFDLVPKELFERPKWGFSIPLHRWLQTDLAYLIDTYLSREQCEKYQIVNYEVMKSYVEDFRNGMDYNFNRLWLIIMLHKSLERTGIS
jgi:asparagine synthase (glutamine-hydrolysing)